MEYRNSLGEKKKSSEKHSLSAPNYFFGVYVMRLWNDFLLIPKNTPRNLLLDLLLFSCPFPSTLGTSFQVSRSEYFKWRFPAAVLCHLHNECLPNPSANVWMVLKAPKMDPLWQACHCYSWPGSNDDTCPVLQMLDNEGPSNSSNNPSSFFFFSLQRNCYCCGW